jgi:predicted Na+-dependent transporter
MFMLNGPEKLLVLLFLVTTMLSIGMTTGVAQLRSMLTSRSLLVRMLVANFVAVPLLGYVLARFMPLAPAAAGALVLLACVPGGLSTIQYSSRVKGEAALAGTMLVLLSVLAVLVSPAILRIVLPASVEFTLPYGRILGFIALWLVVPLGVGMFLRAKAGGSAPKLGKVLGIVSLALFIAFMVVTKSFRKEAVASIGSPAVGAMILFIIASMSIGWFMGGPGRDKRQLFATVTSMRNAAVCLAIARNVPSGDAVMTPLIAFSLLMVTPNTLLTLYSTIRNAIQNRRAAKRADESKEGKQP